MIIFESGAETGRDKIKTTAVKNIKKVENKWMRQRKRREVNLIILCPS
jgi:hypothetical protein